MFGYETVCEIEELLDDSVMVLLEERFEFYKL